MKNKKTIKIKWPKTREEKLNAAAWVRYAELKNLNYKFV
jgi:hypothetical protein